MHPGAQHAFVLELVRWGRLASTDNAPFGTQMHAGDNSARLSASFGLYTTQYGRTFRGAARYSTSPNLELTRFRGHLNLWKVRESRNAQNKTAVPV